MKLRYRTDISRQGEADERDRPRSTAARTKALFSPHPRGDEPVDELNIPWRFHYCVIAIVTFNISAPVLINSRTPVGVELGHPLLVTTSIIGVILAPVFLLLARRWKWEFKYPFFLFVMTYGVASIAIASAHLDDLRAPLMATMLGSPIGAAYYFKPRHATIFVKISAGVIVWNGYAAGTSVALVQSVFLSIVMLTSAMMLISLRRHLIEVVQNNRTLSELDALTGASNVRCFERRLAEEIERHERGGRPFALVSIDLDDFKQVNDRFSHTLGDEVLVASCDAMRSEMADSDQLVRRGGDEFLILAPASDGRNLDDLSRRLAAAVARARHELCADVIPSATTAWIERARGDSGAALLQRVDDALHAVKLNSPSTRRGTVSQDEVGSVIDGVIANAGTGTSTKIEKTTIGPATTKSIVPTVSENPLIGSIRLAWRAAAASTWAFAIATLSFLLAGVDSQPITTMTLAVIVFSIFVLGPAFLWMSRQGDESPFVMHVLATGSLLLIGGGCLAVGDVGPYAAEMFLMPMIIVPALLPWRSSTVYCGLAAVGYVALIAGSGYQPAQLRIFNAVTAASVIAFVVGLTRHHTVKAAAEASSLARIDALTGLPNLRRLRARIDDEIRRCSLSGESFGLLMFDLDDFKTVNDHHSHSTGDRVLVAVARSLERTARHADMPARRGGDEFALVVTDCDTRGAELAAQRVGDAVTHARNATCPDVQPTASIGWVVWQPGESIDDLFSRVDLSLHAQKILAHEQNDNPAIAA